MARWQSPHPSKATRAVFPAWPGMGRANGSHPGPTTTPCGFWMWAAAKPFRFSKATGWVSPAWPGTRGASGWHPDPTTTLCASGMRGRVRPFRSSKTTRALFTAWPGTGRGERVASGADDHTVRIWDAGRGKALQVLEGHQDLVYRVTWLDDSFLASSDYQGGTIIWNVDTQSIVARYHHPGWVSEVHRRARRD